MPEARSRRDRLQPAAHLLGGAEHGKAGRDTDACSVALGEPDAGRPSLQSFANSPAATGAFTSV